MLLYWPKIAKVATSSGVPNLPKGICFRIYSLNWFDFSEEPWDLSKILVSMAPGAIALTLTPSLANYKAQHLVKLLIAALAPEYIDIAGWQIEPTIEDIFKIFPLDLSIKGKHWIVTFTNALTSKLKILS